jgi:uncharacterized protein
MNKSLISIIIVFVFIVGIVIGFYFSPFKTKEIIKEVDKNSITERQIESNIVAVDNKGNGVTAKLITEVRPGQGLVLVNINKVLADLSTQYSARIAAVAASNYTNISLNNVDISYSIIGNASVVGGPSAGSMMAVSTIAALQNKTLDNKIFMTGTIKEDGSIGEVGSILEKGKAAKEQNGTLFLVPKGLGKNIIKYKEEKSCNLYKGIEFCEIKYVPEKIDISEKVGIKVREVDNVKEAIKYFYDEI